ncbi:DUF3515 domain-containing protein [Streptomyces barkulensis]|uniref:DUF3515 domain-containing protein n=1 Tax=Streptomyces barkulensis TaxID=1257026 RepID=UPI00156FF132|nr:DUF3515 domain-containing protein [Streptomyces barkulensis]
MSFAPRRSLPSALRAPAVLLAVLAAAAGCVSGGDRPGPPVPSPTGEAAGICRELYGALPGEVDGQPRGEVEPGTRFAAVWGDPAIELGCGVPRPEVLTPGSEHYNPVSESVDVNGVSWLLEKRDGGHRFTLLDREVFVRVTVPDSYAPEVNALVDLADAVRETVPEKPL